MHWLENIILGTRDATEIGKHILGRDREITVSNNDGRYVSIQTCILDHGMLYFWENRFKLLLHIESQITIVSSRALLSYNY